MTVVTSAEVVQIPTSRSKTDTEDLESKGLFTWLTVCLCVLWCSCMWNHWLCLLLEDADADADEEDDDGMDSDEEESEEDLTETTMSPPNRPPYSLIPPPPVWMQGNHGLGEKKIKHKTSVITKNRRAFSLFSAPGDLMFVVCCSTQLGWTHQREGETFLWSDDFLSVFSTSRRSLSLSVGWLCVGDVGTRWHWNRRSSSAGWRSVQHQTHSSQEERKL